MQIALAKWDLIEIKLNWVREAIDLQFRSQMKALREKIKADGVEGLSVLDYGAGRSPYADLFTSAKRFIAVDPHHPAAPYRDIPIGIPFDRILLIEVLEHLPDPRRTLRDLASRLREDGKIWISVPFAARVHGVPDDYWRWTSQGLTKLAAESGLHLESISSRGNAIGVITSKIAFLTLRCLKSPKTFPLGILLGLFALTWMLPLAWLTEGWDLPVEDPLGYFLVLSPSEGSEITESQLDRSFSQGFGSQPLLETGGYRSQLRPVV